MRIPGHITGDERDYLVQREADYWNDMNVFDDGVEVGDEGYTEGIQALLVAASTHIDAVRRDSLREEYKALSGIEYVRAVDEEAEFQAAKAQLAYDSDLMMDLMALPEIQIKSARDISVAEYILKDGYVGTFLVPNYAVAGCLAYLINFPKFQGFRILAPIDPAAVNAAAAEVVPDGGVVGDAPNSGE